jgi:uncharacterized membrane protein YphA (DoxX/SURF4 family)
LLAGGVTDLIHGPTLLFAGDPVVLIMARLGYPAYMLTILGVWKLLGAVALLVPRFPRLKEWAYAGVFIELTGAAASAAARGGGGSDLIAPLAFAALTLASWALRPPERIIGTILPTRETTNISLHNDDGTMKADARQHHARQRQEGTLLCKHETINDGERRESRRMMK